LLYPGQVSSRILFAKQVRFPVKSCAGIWPALPKSLSVLEDILTGPGLHGIMKLVYLRGALCTMSGKPAAILAYEEQLAKNVALQIRAGQPRPLWQYFVPFKFLFEIFAAKREMSWFSKDFLFVRKLALDAARDIVEGQDRQESLAEVGAAIKDWLSSHALYSEELHQKQAALADLLCTHYSRLLLAEGKDHTFLVRNAYGSRAEYESFLRRLAAAESEIDRVIVAMRGQSAGLQAQMSAKQRAVTTLRAKDTGGFFPQ